MSPAQAERQVVVFCVLGERLALPIASVREIIRYTPVVDLSPLLGGQIEVGAGSRILIVEAAAGALGLIVDSVGGIVRISPDQISALPAAAKRELGEEIAAVNDRRPRAGCSRRGPYSASAPSSAAIGVAVVGIGLTMPAERWNDLLGGGGDVPDPHGSRSPSSLR